MISRLYGATWCSAALSAPIFVDDFESDYNKNNSNDNNNKPLSILNLHIDPRTGKTDRPTLNRDERTAAWPDRKLRHASIA